MPETSLIVIPAKAGIQFLRVFLDPCLRGGDGLSTAPQNKVTIVSKRHSGNLLAGIQKNSLDTGLRRYDELTVDSYLC
jgi:hypothetical protein